MSQLSGFMRVTSPFLRRFLLTYWMGITVLIGASLGGLDLVERHREVITEGEQISQVVSAALRTSMSTLERQKLVEAYGLTRNENRLDMVNVVLVVDQSGQIAYTSRPTWRGLDITDPLVAQAETNDRDFRMVLECFRLNQSDCMRLRSNDLQMHLGSFTVVRPVQMPSMDLGLHRQAFLVMVNFDTGVVLADFSQDFLLLGMMALLISSLLTLFLWVMTATRLLPQLSDAAQTDGLTRLMNRTSFMEHVLEVLAEAEERDAELIFAILDLDHFKRINDTYGHGCGDAALVSVASVLQVVTRPDDLVCRFGGEEFALLMEVSKQDGRKALERLRLQLQMNSLRHEGQVVPISASIGAASTSDCGYNLDYLYTASDKALYLAKAGGRDRVEWSDGSRSISRLQYSR
jgi:diguanylate cyclase (GGDEF)-like protein